MVNNKNYSAYDGTPPSEDAGDRDIVGGPIYSVEQVTSALENGGDGLKLWTKKCAKDVRELCLDNDECSGAY